MGCALFSVEDAPRSVDAGDGSLGGRNEGQLELWPGLILTSQCGDAFLLAADALGNLGVWGDLLARESIDALDSEVAWPDGKGDRLGLLFPGALQIEYERVFI